VNSLKAGIQYYIEGDKIIFTEKFHLERGYCCGNKCRHCPYIPPHKKNNKKTIKDKKG
jgi:hypothetical protein